MAPLLSKKGYEVILNLEPQVQIWTHSIYKKHKKVYTSKLFSCIKSNTNSGLRVYKNDEKALDSVNL